MRWQHSAVPEFQKKINMISKCISAIRILTVIPVPGKDTAVISSSLPFFPFAGLVLSILTYAVYIITSNYIDITFLSGIIIAGILYISTGGLHYDGIADIADGFGSGKKREKILEIFKDSRLGTFGVSVLIFDILLKVILYSWYCEHKLIIIIIASLVLSRSFQALTLVFTESATPGSGIGSAFCDKKRRLPVVISTLVVISCCLLIVENPLPVVIIIATSLACVTIFITICIKKIGGVTGDCIGAVNEITEISILLTAVFFSHMITLRPFTGFLSR